MLTAKLTEKAKAVEQLSIQLEDARDEMKTLKRKNQANVKVGYEFCLNNAQIESIRFIINVGFKEEVTHVQALTYI